MSIVLVKQTYFITRHCRVNILPNTNSRNKTGQPTADNIVHLIFHRSAVNVVLYSEEGDYRENSHAVVCSNSDSVLFNLLICLEFVLER